MRVTTKILWQGKNVIQISDVMQHPNETPQVRGELLEHQAGSLGVCV